MKLITTEIEMKKTNKRKMTKDKKTKDFKGGDRRPAGWLSQKESLFVFQE